MKTEVTVTVEEGDGLPADMVGKKYVLVYENECFWCSFVDCACDDLRHICDGRGHFEEVK